MNNLSILILWSLGYNWPFLTTFYFLPLYFTLKTVYFALCGVLNLYFNIFFSFSFLSYLFLKVVFNALYDNPDKSFGL